MLKNLEDKNAAAVPLTKAGEQFENLAWAPSADLNLIAMNDFKGDDNPDTDLCLANVTSEATNVSCKPEPDFSIIRALHWAPDGRSILGVGVKLPAAATPTFGIVRWRVKQDKPAFSPDVADWNSGKFVTDIDKPGKGVLDAAISPDGKRLALVSNLGSAAFRVWLDDDPDDFLMTSAKPTVTRACKVTWRGDSAALLVVQGAADCSEDVSSLVRLDPSAIRNERDLNAAGDDPSFQPFTLGG
jgi:WD40 repeat protein